MYWLRIDFDALKMVIFI